MRPPILLALLVLGLPGCGSAPPPTHPPVPPVPAESVPAPPPSQVALIWRPGHYEWTGSDYVWIPGEWVERGGHGTLWQDGFWRSTPAGDVWVPGHWI